MDLHHCVDWPNQPAPHGRIGASHQSRWQHGERSGVTSPASQSSTRLHTKGRTPARASSMHGKQARACRLDTQRSSLHFRGWARRRRRHRRPTSLATCGCTMAAFKRQQLPGARALTSSLARTRCCSEPLHTSTPVSPGTCTECHRSAVLVSIWLASPCGTEGSGCTTLLQRRNQRNVASTWPYSACNNALELEMCALSIDRTSHCSLASCSVRVHDSHVLTSLTGTAVTSALLPRPNLLHPTSTSSQPCHVTRSMVPQASQLSSQR